jgi:hydrogenase-4 component B
VRLAGIALLGRPRSPRGAGAAETSSPARVTLLVLAGIVLLAGILPGPGLWLLADPAIQALAGIPPGPHAGFSVTSAGLSGYLPLPVLALMALATGGVILAQRWTRGESKIAGPWAGGMAPPAGLPFGEPAAQSTGEGFLPPLPANPLPRLPRMPSLPLPRPLSPAGIMWLVLASFGALLLILAVTA